MRIDTIEEARTVNEGIRKYLVSRIPHDPGYFPVDLYFAFFAQTQGIGRGFYLAFDLRINFAHLNVSMFQMMNRWSRKFSPNKTLEMSTEDRFIHLLEFHEVIGHFIMRFRATLDKIMSLAVIIFCNENYESSRKGSRRKKFLHIFSEVNWDQKIKLTSLVEKLETFEREYRTPEIHDAGKIRKWVFDIEKNFASFSPFIDYWNDFVAACHALDTYIRDSNKAGIDNK